jgi:GTP-binding protein
MSEPIVAIVGRPNVGKSTLFNRLIGRRQAIIDDKPGVTRDRNYAITDWNGQQFVLVDTGGYVPKTSNQIDGAVREQVNIAVEESDLIVFLVDARTGITTVDEQIAQILQRVSKEIILVVNKMDNENDMLELGQFYNLGIGEPIPVSAMTGKRTGDFLDKITQILKTFPVDVEKDDFIKLAIVGKENVGKSSLVNTFLVKERHIVTDIPGTTRDSIDSYLKYKNHEFLLIDTAGLKKKAKIKENVLFYSNLRTYRSINRADVVIYMIDAEMGLSRQDANVITDAEKERKGILLVYNKWDLVAKDHRTADEIRKEIKEKLGMLKHIPIIFTSVTEKKRLYKMLDLAINIYKDRKKKIPTSELNAYLLPIFKSTTPPAIKGKEIKINYVNQVKTEPPLFIFFSNFPELIAEHYKRFIENKIREKYGFEGVPISFKFRKK